MRKLLLAALVAIAGQLYADNPWKWRMTDKQNEATLHIDLYEETVDVPTMDMFGPMNGYLAGKGIYGVWMVTSFEIESNKVANVRLSNDLGSETQKTKLTILNDSTCQLDLVGPQVIKKVVNKKLVKIPTSLLLKR
ncbi:MAG: hypothetical protein HUK02_06435 [Bacteroidaceae bacterium]|nr:hypothetical protein [Bacteroidaceae bacterium]